MLRMLLISLFLVSCGKETPVPAVPKAECFEAAMAADTVLRKQVCPQGLDATCKQEPLLTASLDIALLACQEQAR